MSFLNNIYNALAQLLQGTWPLFAFGALLLLLTFAQTVKDWLWERSPEGKRYHNLLRNLVQSPSTEQEFGQVTSALRRARRDSLKGSPDVGDTPSLK